MATKPFIPPPRLEVAYRRAISNLFVKHVPKKSNLISIDEWLRHLARVSHTEEIIEGATNLAKQMVSWINVENMKDWRQASQTSQRSQYLYELLQKELKGSVGTQFNELVKRQASLLANTSQEVAVRLSGEIAAAQQRGARPEAVADLLRHRFPVLAAGRIKLLARTGVSSSSTLLTQARCEDLDLQWAQWYTSKDTRVRPSHRNMDGVLYSWKDLPSPEELIGLKPTLGHYAPGDCPNCRCGPLPILTIEDIFTEKVQRVRVYSDGAIHYMSRPQFVRISGIESRKAA